METMRQGFGHSRSWGRCVPCTFPGLPIWGIISPITGLLRVDRAPTSTEAGHVYTYEYQKDTALSVAADTVPFNNAVFRAMVPMWLQLYKREERGEFDLELYKMSMGRAVRFCIEGMPSTNYSPREQ